MYGIMVKGNFPKEHVFSRGKVLVLKQKSIQLRLNCK